MKRTSARRFVIYLFVLVGMAMVTESCKSSKNCGCGSDINGNYKIKRKYR